MPDEFALRDFLKRAFQVDLPIRGGDGNEATPVVVAAPALPVAVEVMAVVLRCLGVARRIGWRLVDLEIVSPEKKLVARAGIETLRTRGPAVCSSFGRASISRSRPWPPTARRSTFRLHATSSNRDRACGCPPNWDGCTFSMPRTTSCRSRDWAVACGMPGFHSMRWVPRVRRRPALPSAGSGGPTRRCRVAGSSAAVIDDEPRRHGQARGAVSRSRGWA